MSESCARFFADVEAAADSVVGELRAGDLVLIKGSRGVHLEKIIGRLRSEYELVAG